jgi:type I site-specific restriction endonuclease
VHGILNNPGQAVKVFSTLLNEDGARPFLFATNGKEVLFGDLTDSGLNEDPQSEGPPLYPSLHSALSKMVGLRESVSDLTTLIDHRYDRPFA